MDPLQWGPLARLASLLRDFARATGQLAKTDAIDAQMLALFGQAVRPEQRSLPSKKQRELQQQLARRRQLVGMLTSEKNRLQQTTDTLVRNTIEAVGKTFKEQLEILDQYLQRTIEETPTNAAICCLEQVPSSGSSAKSTNAV